MEIIKPLMTALASMPPVLMVVMALILLSGAMAYHYLTKIYPKNLELKAKHSERMLELEEIRNKEQQNMNKFLRESSTVHESLLNQSNEAVKDLKEIMKAMSQTFREVSERLATHAKASEQTNDMVKEMYREMPSQGDLEKIKTEIRDMAKDAISKHDAELIRASIDKVDAKLDACLAELKRIER